MYFGIVKHRFFFFSFTNPLLIFFVFHTLVLGWLYDLHFFMNIEIRLAFICFYLATCYRQYTKIGEKETSNNTARRFIENTHIYHFD